MHNTNKKKVPFYSRIVYDIILSFVLILIVSGNFLTFLDFGCKMECCETKTSSCCQVEKEHTCKTGFISCSPKVLILIPLVLLDKHQDNQNHISAQLFDFVETHIDYKNEYLPLLASEQNTGPPDHAFQIPLRI